MYEFLSGLTVSFLSFCVVPVFFPSPLMLFCFLSPSFSNFLLTPFVSLLQTLPSYSLLSFSYLHLALFPLVLYFSFTCFLHLSSCLLLFPLVSLEHEGRESHYLLLPRVYFYLLLYPVLFSSLFFLTSSLSPTFHFCFSFHLHSYPS